MRLARIECDDDALVREIDHYILHATDLHQGGTKLANALIAIFSFRCDLDRFQDRVIRPFRIKWIARFRIIWSCRVHCLLSNVRGRLRGCLACNRLENAPDVFGQNSLPSGIWMNAVGQVQ